MRNPYDPGPLLPVDADGRVRFSVTLPYDPGDEEMWRRMFPTEPVVIPFDGPDAARVLALSMAIESPRIAASLVSLATVETYLAERGWTRGECPRWAQGRAVSWDAPPRFKGDTDFGVLLTLDDTRPDHSRVIADAASGVGVHEDRGGAHVLAAWLLAQHETGAYRVAPERT